MEPGLSEAEAKAAAPIGVEDGLALAAVVMLPWMFGGVELWAFRMAAGLLGLAAAAAVVRYGSEVLGPAGHRRWLLPAFLLAAWAGCQLIPLPPAALRAIDHRGADVYANALPGYPGTAPARVTTAVEDLALARVPATPAPPADAAGAPGFAPEVRGNWSRWRPISLDRAATVERLFWYLALLAGFVTVRRRTLDPRRWAAYRAVLFALFGLLAVFALVQSATWNGRIYWIRSVTNLARPFGPYVNFVHFASVMEMAVPWMVAFAWTRIARERGLTPRTHVALLVASVAVLCAGAAVAAASKATVLLLFASVSAVVVLGVRGGRRRVLAALGIAALAAVSVWALSDTLLAERFRELATLSDESAGDNARLVVLEAGLPMAKDFILTGSGFGSFAEAFPAYLRAGDFGRWLQLHNDYVQVVIEGGAVTAGLIAWLAWGFWRRATASISETRPDSLERFGLVLGVLSLFLHATVDFNHQIPANALLFVTLAALATAAGERARAGVSEEVR